MWTRLVVLLLIGIVVPRESYAQLDVRQCEGVLAKDLLQFAESRRVQLAILRLYSDEVWSEFNREQGASGSVFGVKLGASSNEFKQNWQRRFEQEQTQFSSAEDFRYAHAVTSERAYQAYEHCIHALQDSGRPVRIAPVKVSPTAVQIHVIVRNPASVTNLKLRSEIVGATVPELWNGVKKWPTNGEDIFNLTWADGASEMRITVRDTHNRGNATLAVVRADGEAVLVSVGTQSVRRDTKHDIENTPTNHNKEYDRDECDGAIDGWCLSRTELRVQAAAGRYLQIPDQNGLTCLGFSDQVVALKNHPSAFIRNIVRDAVSPPCGTHLRVTGPTLSSDRRTATAIIENYSWGLKWQLTAFEMEDVPRGETGQVWGPGPVWVGRDFVLIVPAAIATNETPLVISIGNDRGFIRLSDASATVGPFTIQRLSQNDGQSMWVRQYRIARSQPR